jgi:DNA recombination protein RmuC
MTLAAILCTFRAGHQTMAIERRASEVWKVLGAVKTEFGKFGDVLASVKRQLATASNTIDKTGVRTRAMERQLRAIEEVPDAEAARLLAFANPDLGDPEWDHNGQPPSNETFDEPPDLFEGAD